MGASAGGALAGSGGSKAAAGGDTGQGGSSGASAGSGGSRVGTGGSAGQSSSTSRDAGTTWVPGQIPPEVVEVAEPVCGGMCQKLYTVVCSPLPKDMGCLPRCVGGIGLRWAQCPTEVPALLKCRTGAPDSYSYSCDSRNQLVTTDTTCSAEAQAVAACTAKI